MAERYQNLPSAETYRREVEFMPWGELIEKVIGYAKANLRNGATVLDMMCGTGHVLAELKMHRPDLVCKGVDIIPEYIEFAREHYKDITYSAVDVRSMREDIKYDAVLCTGGLHHIHWSSQQYLIQKISALVSAGGFAIVADPYIAPYKDEDERQINAAYLGVEYLRATIRNGAPMDVVKATVNLIPNDVLGVEYKTSIERIEPMFQKHFKSVDRVHVWPAEPCSYGDFYFICRP